MFSKWQLCLVALTALAALDSGVAIAQQQEPVLGGEAHSAPPPAAWASQCVADARSSVSDCSVFQRGVTETGQLVGSVTLRIPPGASQPVLVILAPLGLYVPAGISFSIDGASPQTLQIQTCDQNGCFASQPVGEATLSAMLKGQKLDITFANMNQQAITLPLTLVGFTAAYDRIK